MMLPQGHGASRPWQDRWIDPRLLQAAQRTRQSRNPLLEPREGDVVVFLLAHPDDESLFTGGTIARVAETRAVTVVVTATRGELVRPNDPLVRARLRDDVPLESVRQVELRRACAELGVTDHFFLGRKGRFADSGYDRKRWDANSFATNVDGTTIELISLLRTVNPGRAGDVRFGRLHRPSGSPRVPRDRCSRWDGAERARWAARRSRAHFRADSARSTRASEPRNSHRRCDRGRRRGCTRPKGSRRPLPFQPGRRRRR
jgi:LmbE family N-acetylglucosaminyl deacetylase